MATVRYKVMNAPERIKEETGKVISCTIAPEKLKCHVEKKELKAFERKFPYKEKQVTDTQFK